MQMQLSQVQQISNEREMTKKLSLLYVIGTYPSLTTTFIDREIEWLRTSGVNVQVLAIRRPSSKLSPEQEQIGEGTIYLLPAPLLALLWAHLASLLRHPITYLR